MAFVKWSPELLWPPAPKPRRSHFANYLRLVLLARQHLRAEGRLVRIDRRRLLRDET